MEQDNRHPAHTRSGFLRSLSTAVTMVALVSLFGTGGGIAAAAEKSATSQASWDPPYTSQLEFLGDLHTAANEGLAGTKIGESMNPDDLTNPWAVFDNYIDRVTIHCVNKLTPKWNSRLAGYDVYIYDQCMSMEQSLRLDGPSM